MSDLTTCHSLCRCTCGDYYEVHVFNGLVSEFEPESHDTDCPHAKVRVTPEPQGAQLVDIMGALRASLNARGKR